MITDADINKMKKVFATAKGVENGFLEIIEFIGEVKSEIMNELNEFRNEFNEFRNEIRDINRTHESILNNHEARITHLEFTGKS